MFQQLPNTPSRATRAQRRLTLAAFCGLIVAWTANVRADVGNVTGQAAVNGNGAATYSFPIELPPGINGLTPRVELYYSSQNGRGHLGAHWDIGGLSEIVRCKKTLVQNNASNAPQLVTTDALCLDGQQLRLITAPATYGLANSQYRKEFDDHTLVTLMNGDLTTGWFEVRSTDGQIREYGRTSDSIDGVGLPPTAIGWRLSSVKDRNSNYISYSYARLGQGEIGRLVSIQYTGNSNMLVAPTYTVSFNYPMTGPSFGSGSINGQFYSSSGMLGSVEVKVTATSQVIRSYQIAYNVTGSPGAEHYTVQSIQQCASTTSNCFAPVTFGWTSNATNWPSAQSAGTISAGPSVVMDMNGDGYEDLVFYDGAVWKVMWGTATGYGSVTSTGYGSSDAPGAPGPYMGQISGPLDFDGDGRMDLLVPYAGYWRWLHCDTDCKATGTFLFTNTNIFTVLSELIVENPGSSEPTYITNFAHATSGDVDGDGYVDLITEMDGNITVYLHAHDGSPSLLAGASGGTGKTLVALTDATTASSRHYRMDVDGGGRNEVLSVDSIGAQRVLYSNGTVFSPGTEASRLWMIPISLNADDCLDFLSNAGNLLSNCGFPGNAGLGAPTPISATRPIPIDWDNDGVEEPYDVAAQIPSTSIIRISDINGDGLQDVTAIANNGAVSYYLHPGVKPELLTSITDSFGNTTTFNYQTLSGGHCYTRDSGVPPVNSGNRALSPVNGSYVVCSMTASDGIGGSYTQSFTYSNIDVNVQGRGVLGFEKRSITDSRTSILHEEQYRMDFPFTGMLASSTDKQSGGALIASTSNTWQETVTGTGTQASHYPYVSSTTTTRYEVGGIKNSQLISTTTTNYTYDSYGNATNVATTIADNDSTSPYLNSTWSSTTATSFSPNTTTWCVALPTGMTVTNTAPGVPSITRTVTYPSPDYTLCRETTKVTESSSSYALTEAYGYDNFGNVNAVTTSGVGVPVRTTLVNWGTAGRFPMTLTNALNEVTTNGYDFNFGVLTSTTDPNNLTTSWQYDGFGRRIQETRVDGTYTTWSFADCASSACLIGPHAMVITQKVYNKDNSVQISGTSYLDPSDRPLIDIKQNLAGGYDRNEVRYDALGRISQRAAPCTWSTVTTACSYWTTYVYDILSRETSESRPISASNPTLQTTTIAYQGRTRIVTDPQGKTTTKIMTVAGTLGRSQDHNGYYQSFTYDAFGNPTTVTDSLSNTLMTKSYAYGVDAFMVGMSDMEFGSVGYTINALGEMTNYLDANGTNFTLTYDLLSRPRMRTVVSDGTTTEWTWGSSAASFNLGQLAQLTTTGGPTLIYSYDNKGRLSQRRIVGDATTYDYDYTYDDAKTGMVDTQTYPTSTSGYRLKLKYDYQAGMMVKVTDFNSATVYWQANAANSRGQITQETLGNGLVTNRIFDAMTGWLSSSQCAMGGGTCSQNQSYLYDQVGNLTQRQNNNLGLTENFYYDNLYRLQSSKLNNVTNLTMGYDALGNITSRSDLSGGATWTYDPIHKHRVTQAGSASNTYSYDANGNAIGRNGYSITWSKYNFPTQINGNGESTSFVYDGNNQRWKQVYVKGAVTETTTYVGGRLEKVSVTGQPDDYRHYIFANGQAVAIVSRLASGANTTRYLLRDALDSVTKITSSSGTDVVSESFSAWGTKRNPLTWSGAPTNGDLVASNGVTRQGFTGQAGLGGMGLNHMNGRVQDAVTGRFLSADPYLNNPGNTQSYNRYSYVMNNPLSFVDPSGYQSCSQQIKDNGTTAPYVINTPAISIVNFYVPDHDCLDDVGNPGDLTPINFGSDIPLGLYWASFGACPAGLPCAVKISIDNCPRGPAQGPENHFDSMDAAAVDLLKYGAEQAQKEPSTNKRERGGDIRRDGDGFTYDDVQTGIRSKVKVEVAGNAVAWAHTHPPDSPLNDLKESNDSSNKYLSKEDWPQVALINEKRDTDIETYLGGSDGAVRKFNTSQIRKGGQTICPPGYLKY